MKNEKISIIVLVNEKAKHFHKILMIKTPNFHSMNISKDETKNLIE